jgi:hypothetical protein
MICRQWRGLRIFLYGGAWIVALTLTLTPRAAPISYEATDKETAILDLLDPSIFRVYSQPRWATKGGRENWVENLGFCFYTVEVTSSNLVSPKATEGRVKKHSNPVNRLMTVAFLPARWVGWSLDQSRVVSIHARPGKLVPFPLLCFSIHTR